MSMAEINALVIPDLPASDTVLGKENEAASLVSCLRCQVCSWQRCMVHWSRNFLYALSWQWSRLVVAACAY